MVLAYGICLRRAALLAGLCLAGGMHAHAGDDAAVLNPTGRVLEMIAPLNFGPYSLGDLAIRILPSQEVEVPKAALLAAVKPLLRAKVYEALAAASATCAGDHCNLARLRDAGFDFRFDPAAVAIIVYPSLDQKAEGDIRVQADSAITESPNAAEAADLSAFLNLRSAVDYIGDSPSGWAGLRAPAFDLEGAIRWQSLVLEAEGTYEPDDFSWFGERGDGFRRRGTRLVRDFEEDAVRASLGDVYPIGTGLQYAPDLLGLSLERSYSKLQPGRNMRSTGRRSFRLERPSSVDIVVNGLTVRKLRLDAGDYNLSDLPVAQGANDMVLLIEDDLGSRQRLEFTSFSDAALLPPGLSEWSFAAGVPAGFTGGEPDYQTDALFVTGFYRRGLSESVTGEAHLQGDGARLMSGLGVMFGGRLGFVALEGAASVDEDRWGAAFDGDYALADIADGGGRMHSLRLSAKARTADFGAPHPAFRLDDDAIRSEWLALSASYATTLPFEVSAALSGGFGFGFEPCDDSYHADLSLSRPLGRKLSLGLSGGYYYRALDADLSLSLRLQYRPDENSSLSASFDAPGRRSSLVYDRQVGQGVGSWETTVDVTHQMPEHTASYEGSEENSVNASLRYTGNRGTVSLSQDSRFAGLDAARIDQRTSLRVETGIAFADGRMAVGRPVSGGFAIVSPADNLAANEITIGGDGSGVVAHTDWLGPALVPSVAPYRLTRVDYDVADLPSGYDLGDGLFDLMPKNGSGYKLTVGSSYTVTALGTLIGADGEPVALLTGVAIEEKDPARRVELFTNREGRFSAQGLAPGIWLIEMASEPRTLFQLTVPPDTVGFYRAEPLRPLREGK
ncbi:MULTISPECIES: fimbria/pilus outer membrane usher protein [Rhodomicrobium]|uniref:fimbria/pilus outer membrane usher protein n=1 Tax=Rhodomicrobium TaxID=1068 RepID=UPI000B4B22DB|nr:MULTISPECIES: fimbria/pilus outer membrane usher protein [Rhodomicrobium]